MASLTITVPDAMVPDLVAAVKYAHPEIDFTGMTDAQSARRVIRDYLRVMYVDWRRMNTRQVLLAALNAQEQDEVDVARTDAEQIV